MVTANERWRRWGSGFKHIYLPARPSVREIPLLARLARGLARIHWLQEREGIEPDAAFVSAGRLTVSRHQSASLLGFPYGGRLSYTGDFVPIGLKPTGCGFLVAGLDQLPDPARWPDRCRDTLAETTRLDGREIEWDLSRGRHFVQVYRVQPQELLGRPFAAVIHCSGAEWRMDGPEGPGLYAGQSAYWRNRIRKRDTPWGPVSVLEGADGREYLALAGQAARFAQKRRECLARLLFDDPAFLFDQIHHGLDPAGGFVLGCHAPDPKADANAWLPLMTGPGRTAYLIRPLDPGPNGLTSGMRQRWGRVGKKTGAIGRVLPHGTGGQPGPGPGAGQWFEVAGVLEYMGGL
jgi:hypothetical protein